MVSRYVIIVHYDNFRRGNKKWHHTGSSTVPGKGTYRMIESDTRYGTVTRYLSYKLEQIIPVRYNCTYRYRTFDCVDKDAFFARLVEFYYFTIYYYSI